MADSILKAGQRLLVCQTRRSRTARFWIDEEAVAAAIDVLGLREPVRIRKTSSGGWRRLRKCGTHSFGIWVTPNGGLVLDSSRRMVRGHDITITAGLSAEVADRTLHHELQHAWQEENWMQLEKRRVVRGSFTSEYLRDTDKYERDATEAEKRHEAFPLTTEWRMT